MLGSQMIEKFQRLRGVVFYQNYWSSRQILARERVMLLWCGMFRE